MLNVNLGILLMMSLMLNLGSSDVKTTGTASVENDCECSSFTTSALLSEPIFSCERTSAGAQYVKCRVERGKVTYLFQTRKVSPTRHELTITASSGGSANKVYNSDMTIVDNRSTSKEFTVQIMMSENTGYQWKTHKADVLKATYNLNSSSISFEATGRMKDCVDTRHGYTQADLRNRLTPPRFNEDNVIKAVVTYFILEYNKALLPKS